MWIMIQSLTPVVEAIAPAFTQPAFTVSCELFLAWVMCLGQHRLRRTSNRQ